ncbi:MAG: hypothetical protein II695_01515, partial [Oscillospiraceae bacterium]|nr:hypothetical protein [Oscillospiraceae bacterium]
MEDWLRQVKDGWNETADSQWYRSLRTDERIDALVKSTETAFHPKVYDIIGKFVPDMSGKRILLPSSGDNHAAFAFALLG